MILSASPLDELKSLNQARTSLMACDSVDDVIQRALELIRDKLNSQVASIFLFTKNGVIKRRGINGIDKDGNSIENTWFPDEEYAPGASFSGRAIPTFEEELGFGEPQWSNDLYHDFTLDEETKRPYLNKLGNLNGAISVPLNGRYRTFGTIEVLNKLDDKKFTYDDVYWLSHIATIVANFVSDTRKKKEVDFFTEITQKLILVEETNHDLYLQAIYNLVVEKVTEYYTPYKACILRVLNKDKSSKIESKSGTSDVYWSNIEMNVEKPYSGIAKEVLQTKKPIFITDIDLNKNRFCNRKFINDNCFKSYACIPLLIKGELFGTISVFIGYSHKFSTNHENFLINVGYLTAATIARVRLIRDLKKVSQERDEAKDNIISAIRFARVDYFLQGVLHDYKNDLLGCYQILQTISDGSNSRKADKSINNKMQWIEERVAEIQKEFTPATSKPVDINNVVQEIAKAFSKLSDKNLQIIAKYEPSIPIIAINESQIKDIVFNLISNAVRAAKKDNKKTGKILVVTSLITLNHIEYIQIVVEDNGIGIGHEVKEQIFEKGFTTNNDERGTGMGLFLAREIINNYGGKIYCESSVGKGTKFFIKIPLKRHLL